ncbi:hypothetical protein EG328_006141 [Venturia inaequalis]|uniref:Uncharacterized protein n=1 Tax=Venturia inaequalis TaxID=5025 RepID=A0A8H3UJN6_VENIN|nr:hypothetical protein EG328_006141 [Venturia inaequalis]
MAQSSVPGVRKCLIVFATHDFTPSSIFTAGQTYLLAIRNTTDYIAPMKAGIALLDSEGVHHGWVSEKDRQPIEALLKRGSEERWDEVLEVSRKITHGGGRWFTVQAVETGDAIESEEDKEGDSNSSSDEL